jgi:hypothetical protein
VVQPVLRDRRHTGVHAGRAPLREP